MSAWTFYRSGIKARVLAELESSTPVNLSVPVSIHNAAIAAIEAAPDGSFIVVEGFGSAHFATAEAAWGGISPMGSLDLGVRVYRP